LYDVDFKKRFPPTAQNAAHKVLYWNIKLQSGLLQQQQKDAIPALVLLAQTPVLNKLRKSLPWHTPIN
jgi:hypothetical protein